VGKKVYLQLTLKREQNLELPQDLLNKYLQFRSGPPRLTQSPDIKCFLFLMVNKVEIRIFTFRILDEI